jgi:hypothetical protein
VHGPGRRERERERERESDINTCPDIVELLAKN